MVTKIGIVTVNFDNGSDTVALLKGLAKAETKELETKIIVVDNGSTDGSLEMIREKFPNVEFLVSDTNKGFSGGYNLGIRKAMLWGAEFVLIINNDTLVPDGKLILRLLATFVKDRRIGLVSPKILFAPGFEFHKEKYQKGDIGHVVWYGGGSFDWNNVQSVHRGIDQVDRGQFNKVEEVEFGCACCLLIRREVFDRIGMFDESMFAYFEDNDFLVRAKKAGFKIFYNGRTFIYHKVSRTAGIGSKITDYYTTRNRLIFGMRYASFRTKLALLREAGKFLLIGRPLQRRGAWDFFLGKRGMM